jgi:hypothetical protein
VLSVIVLVTLWNILLSDYVAKKLEGKGAVRETLEEIRQVNVHLQLRFYQVLTSWRTTKLQATRISVAYIDNNTHWTTLYGDSPTSRSFLATLIHNATKTNTRAAAIALDVQLYAPLDFPAGSDKDERTKENLELRKAIDQATAAGVPVVLATGYYVDPHGVTVRIPSIYADSELPLSGPDDHCPRAACAAFGYINPPEDKREIPLQKQLFDSDLQQWKSFDSFAFAMVKAIEGPEGRVSKDRLILKALKKEDGSKLFGSFIEKYPTISVDDLYNADPTAEQNCRGRVVLIGGYWRDVQGHGDLVDSHLSPLGFIPGIQFHANYIESLLQHQFEPEVPTALGVLIDVIVGLIIYMCFELAAGWQKLLVLVLAGAIPVFLAYVFLVNLNLYLDFLLPVELYFVHILYETVRDYIKLKFSQSPRASMGSV